MGIEIGPNKITQASSVLTIDTGVPMRVLAAGPVVRPNQALFVARNTGGTWTNLANGWNIITTFNLPIRNQAGCFSGSRFTAPVAGMYFFQVTGAHLLKDGASVGYYWHPLFAVNGNFAGGVVNNSGVASYRIRGHGVSIASYDDGSITQIYKLAAGDYVEFCMYSNGSPLNRYYAPYQQFTGFLLG